jgi:hypothetical protein
MKEFPFKPGQWYQDNRKKSLVRYITEISRYYVYYVELYQWDKGVMVETSAVGKGYAKCNWQMKPISRQDGVARFEKATEMLGYICT